MLTIYKPSNFYLNFEMSNYITFLICVHFYMIPIYIRIYIMCLQVNKKDKENVKKNVDSSKVCIVQ